MGHTQTEKDAYRKIYEHLITATLSQPPLIKVNSLLRHSNKNTNIPILRDNFTETTLQNDVTILIESSHSNLSYRYCVNIGDYNTYYASHGNVAINPHDEFFILSESNDIKPTELIAELTATFEALSWLKFIVKSQNISVSKTLTFKMKRNNIANLLTSKSTTRGKFSKDKLEVLTTAAQI